jgi:hypothetical protein
MDVNLDQYCFPISERNIAVDDFANDIVDWGNEHTYLPTQDYKAIVRGDTNELISIVRSSYKVIPNALIINKLLQFLASTGENFRIDSSHSFVQNSRMRLQVTFPELVLEDSESDINLSLFVENSYNMSTGLKYYFGAIRMICQNGLILGQILSQYYAKHTKGFEMSDFSASMEQARVHLPTIQQRVNQLEALPANKQLVEQVEEKISKRLAEEVLDEMQEKRLSQWELLNKITHYISHDLDPHLRARHQRTVSRIFEL